MASGEHHAAGSYALIVAADRYSDPGLRRLRSPAQDARELAQVLKDPAIGGYQVQVLVNQPGHVVSEEIEGFFANRRADDLLVLYFSCHGVKDPAGSLYFAASTTKLNRLAASGISSAFVSEQVQRCRWRRIILLLDCCYSGAYLKGHRPRAGDRVSFDPIQGRGWAVITSSALTNGEIPSNDIMTQPAASAPANRYPSTSNLALSLLAYLLPLAMFITLFSRDRVVRMNAFQALEIYIICSCCGQ
jgi:Caspase domain